MTISDAEEHKPLLVGNDVENIRYQTTLLTVKPKDTIALEQRDSKKSFEPDFYLSNLENSKNFNNGTSSSGSSPKSHVNDRITYTWHNINVHTSTLESKRMRITRCLKNCFGNRPNISNFKSKIILKGVNGVAYPGELLAIMGSSGAGKTTLLNVLTFRSGVRVITSGVRAINGQPVSSAQLTASSAYVQQDDLFIGVLTVREHLIFQALVRMDSHIPTRMRMQRVDEVLAELALTKCQNTQIGVPGRVKGISGGEMKRLSFASEVLTDPPIMFCDEPTSGLDSFMAQNVVSVLKGMAMKGKTVVVTIHQPSSEVFAMFDKVLLMAEGRVAYLGTPQNACRFFKDLGATCPSNYNPADFFIQLLAVVPNRESTCRETIELVCDAYDKSLEGVQIAAETIIHPENQAKIGGNKFDIWEEDFSFYSENGRKNSPYKANWWAQFKAVLWRSWLSVIKEPMLIKVRLLQTIMVAVIVSIIYYHQQLTQDGVMNINGALFIFLTNMTFQNVFAVINVFCMELPVFLREHFNGMYRVDVYFLCKTLAEVPFFLVMPIIFTSIVYYLIGLHPGLDHFLTANGIIVLVANVATSFGYLISCLSTGITMALSIGPPVVIPFLLFGGFFLNSGSVPYYFKWLSNLSWFKYGNEALLINQWAGVESIDCTRSNATCPKNGQVILETLNFKEDDFSFDILSLFLLIITFRVLAYAALLLKTLRRD